MARALIKRKDSEADLTKQIQDVLNACKIFHWKQWQGMMSTPRGVSDILGCYQGKLLAIEIKAPKWKPPLPSTKAYKHFKEQEDFIFQVNKAGGIGFFAQSVEEVIKTLDLKVKLYPLFGWRDK
jgi:penicillin-binding protein-related factor A (putative recombinase)